MNTIHTQEQTKQIEHLKQTVIDMFNDIIKLGSEEITMAIPNLKECSLQDCIDYNNSTNYDTIHAKVYSLCIEINSSRTLLAKNQNVIDLLKFKEIAR